MSMFSRKFEMETEPISIALMGVCRLDLYKGRKLPHWSQRSMWEVVDHEFSLFFGGNGRRF